MKSKTKDYQTPKYPKFIKADKTENLKIEDEIRFMQIVNQRTDDNVIRTWIKHFENQAQHDLLIEFDKIIDEFNFSADSEDNILIQRELKTKLEELGK